MSSAPQPQSSDAVPVEPRRQAVLVIHGIGSQRPMDTLAGFVEQTWLKDGRGQERPNRRIWYRPDTGSDNFDLFQIVADEKDRARTDFFELYWAHHMEGTRFASVWDWFWRDLVLRRSADMPRPMAEAKAYVVGLLALVMTVFAVAFGVTGTWLLTSPLVPHWGKMMIAGAALVLALGLFGIGWKLIPVFPAALALSYGLFGIPLLAPLPDWAVVWSLIAAAALAAALLALERSLLSPYIGDAARYLRNTPENIAARQEIRRLGVEALVRLHESPRDYDRIVVVGHSLGSIIGYDILRYAFAERTGDLKIDAAEMPPEIEAFDAASASPGSPAFMPAQRALCEAVGRWGGRKNWIVTDFVTLGSPLAYANILLAGSNEQFRTRVRRRVTPVCPPQRDPALNERGVRGFFRWQDRETGRPFVSPHHGAVFALTRWTNLYFPASQIIFGDIIGGPAGADPQDEANPHAPRPEPPGLGLGIRDVAIDCTHLYGRQIFSHTSYWSLGGERGAPPHIEAIQIALDLDDRGTAASLPSGPCTPARRRILRRLPPLTTSADRGPSS